ncbi:MAG TPA: carbon-nitrogen hydrolase [Pyrinomonadaceae bacterium]|nr:carbon-nitrogen hydrolase [Pyrinomonadaceae bacterium]
MALKLTSSIELFRRVESPSSSASHWRAYCGRDARAPSERLRFAILRRMVKKAKANTINVGLVQMNCVEKPAANLKKALARIGEAAKKGAQIICLQELFRSQYFCQTEDIELFKLAETIPGPTTESLSRVARRKKVVIIASLFEKRAAGVYHNTALIINADGHVAGKYRKMHIPDDPLYYEKFYFTPGDLGFSTHDTTFGKVGTLVCWDQWFPEAARLTALSGAQFLFYPTAIGWLPDEKEEMNQAQHSAWETIQRAHAIANGVFVVVVNRVGHEGKLNFWGQSFVADPFGRIIAKASADKEEVLVVACDLDKIEETRQNWPFLRDRRIDSYGGLSHRFLDPELTSR